MVLMEAAPEPPHPTTPPPLHPPAQPHKPFICICVLEKQRWRPGFTPLGKLAFSLPLKKGREKQMREGVKTPPLAIKS